MFCFSIPTHVLFKVSYANNFEIGFVSLVNSTAAFIYIWIFYRNIFRNSISIEIFHFYAKLQLLILLKYMI